MDKPRRPFTDPSMVRQAHHRLEQGREATGSGSSRPFDKLRVVPSEVEGRAKSRDERGDETAQNGGAQSREAEGVVMELLPSQLVRVELNGRHQVTAHLADPVRRNFVRVLVGDRVRVVVMAHDPKRARIVEKLE